MNEAVIPILRVADADAAADWYARLGFAKQWEHQFEPGFPRFVEVARGEVRLYLSEHDGDARPDTLIYLRLADLDALAAAFDTPVERHEWGRELAIRDIDGNRLRIGDPVG